MLQNAEDIGFLAVDAERNELLFEGDQKRFRIPAAAIQSVGVETMGSDEAPMGMVVLTVTDATLGERELPIRPIRFSSGAIEGARTDRAGYLAERIGSLGTDSSARPEYARA